MPFGRQSDTYNMDHARRGLAIIFNHKKFEKNLGLSVRKGTEKDRDKMKATLLRFGFEVHVHNDLKFKVSRMLNRNLHTIKTTKDLHVCDTY